MPRIPPELCAKCKGYKRLCGLPRCPILDMFRGQLQASLKLSGNLARGDTPPGALVGESGYPRVNLYFLIPPGEHGDNARFYDDPITWEEKRVPLSQIIRLRSGMVAGRLALDAKNPFSLYESEVALAVVSERPVSSEALLAKPPLPRLRFHGITKPLGPVAPAEKVVIEDSPRVPRRLEMLIWDDASARDAVWEAYRSGIDIYTIQRAFSLGMMGRLKRRRLVPTRWSITAVDELLSGIIREHIRVNPPVDNVEVYHNTYLGNKFTVILLPGPGSIEWVEVWHPNTIWTRGSSKPVVYSLYEDPLGKKTMDDGGYSAAKIAVLEHLWKRGRTADIVIIREILPSYYAPIGNWHIRETVRRALGSGPVASFSSIQEAKSLVDRLVSKEYRDLIYSRTGLLGYKRKTTRLTDYF